MTNQQSFDADLQIAEPHFDEEATLLSARPVVPLKTVAAKPRLNRSWGLGLALTGALLIGVVATAIYYTRFKRESLTAADSQTIFSGAEASATVSDSASGSPAAVEGASANGETTAAVRDPMPSAQAIAGRAVQPPAPRAKSSLKSSKKSPTHTVAGPSDEDRRLDAQDEWRAQRREIRERRREGRDRSGRPADDLLRIREIFEGRRKP